MYKDVVFRQIKKESEDKDMFTSYKFKENASKYESYSNVMFYYSRNAEQMKAYINQLLDKITSNERIIPYTIRCLCNVVGRLVQKRVNIENEKSLTLVP